MDAELPPTRHAMGIPHRKLPRLRTTRMPSHAPQTFMRWLLESERYHKATGKTERKTRYYITSLKPDGARLNRGLRQHWGIENKLHWVLDVGFGEDLDRKRAGHAAQNFSLLNRIALNMLKQDTTFKRGIKGKRLKAAWNHPYLLKLLGI
ncbi:MAG TPA: ISAs1 family transposase [Acidobacteriaceae bacterium]|nr:ISAs1 family transposase [Acidobacteriaceae bacterium]